MDLHGELAKLSRHIHGETRPHYEPVVGQFTALAARHISGVDDAGAVLSIGRGGWRTVSEPGCACCLLEELHRDCDEGPGIDAAHSQQAVHVTDLAVETRWPRFTTAAAGRTPTRSMLCLPLYSHVHTWGAMLLLGDEPGGLGAPAQEDGEIVATHTALTLEAVHHDRNHRSALGSRDIIGQAKGVLMERFDIDAVDAFSLLTRLAEESHRPVVVIAKELLDAKEATNP